MKNNKKLALKALLAALAVGAYVTSPIATTTVHAELVDETDDWDKEGDTEYEDITDQENNEHDNNSNTQDADAHVDNSNGGTDEEHRPDPVDQGNADPTRGEVTDWENYDPTKDPNWDAQNPVLPDDLEDEVDRKSDDDIPKTADSTPWVPVGIALGGAAVGLYLVIDSKKAFVLSKKDVKVLRRTK